MRPGLGKSARHIYDQIRALPPAERRELLRLLVSGDEDDLQDWMDLSADSFAEIWDNDYDAIYDAVPTR